MSKTEFIVDKEKLEVRMSRIYKASPERLYKAYTTPEEVVNWWGPSKYETVLETMDVRVGGQWRMIHKDGNGQEYAFRGEYKRLEEPHLISNTFEFEGMPGHVLVETATFEDQGDGTTKLSTVSKYENLADLEGMVESGMESGAVESMERLGTLVERD